MINWKTTYEEWLHYNQLDPIIKKELQDLSHYPQQLEDAFYQDLAFGTGGMRGVLGPGTNRMNIYTVRKAVYGLAQHLCAHAMDVKERGVAVAYDSRHQSKEFALEAAKVLGHSGIKTFVFSSLRPTPLLSFAVRYLGCVAGIMITASHNPPEYNGLKVYNQDGGQMVPEEVDQLVAEFKKIEHPFLIPTMEKSELEGQGLLHWMDQKIDEAYLEKLAQLTKMDESRVEREKDLKVVFTPLHGTAEKLVMQGLRQLHFTQVHIVRDQAVPDPNFSTVDSPNPEEQQAFAMAIALGEQIGADLLLATDPDSDRLGVAVKQGDTGYQILTGNQLGVLLLDYLLSHMEPSVQNARFLKSIVTTELGRKIADSYGVQTIETLTGFKYIGEKIREFEETEEVFMFGFEESYGYLIDGFVRDKDAVQAAVMVSEMAYAWKQKGETLFDALEQLYATHGYYQEGMSSQTLKGKEGSEKITQIMETYRTRHLTEIANLKVEQIEDYLVSERLNLADGKSESIYLPKENVLKFILENDCWFCLRPSGTEPKIKYYYGVCEDSWEKSTQLLATLKREINALFA